MKILHVDAGKSMRGGQWQTFYLAMGQKTLGLSPLLLAPARSPLLRLARERGLECKPLSWFTLWRESRRHALTHAHDARSHTMAALVARSPLVVTRRVAFPIGTSCWSKWKYRRAARYFAISRFVAGTLQAAGIPAERIALVYDGVPLEQRAPGGRKFVAPRWQDSRKATQLARQAAHAAGVELIESDQLLKDLQQARALIYLSEVEGLGSAALLALGAGIPVIASRAGGLPEIVRHEQTGLLVSNELDSVVRAIRRLDCDEALARRLGSQGREMVKNGFTLAHMALRSVHEYQKLMAPASASKEGSPQ
ncbi:MAG: glycosyltransferase family 4 protein [Bryobacteraceae bacterium]|nr:glycosyltransferase family 4 protein [Bryobacteraceae bacterium]MDW8377098.1 glycosyltransferase family 4 protein [Bryobacterales bacterium]